MVSETAILERQFFPKGRLILREGDPGTVSYLIQSGSVTVFSEEDGRRVDLASFEPGQIFGELALVFDAPRTASVEAREDCNLIIISRDTLEHKLQSSDRTIRAIVSMLTERITTTNNSLVRPDESIRGFIDRLRISYQSILTGLPNDDRSRFQVEVLPKLDGLLDSLETFNTKG